MSSILPTADSYNALPYANFVFPLTHPLRISATLSYHGYRHRSLRGARVLEVGCAAGGNLIPMADSLPETSFVGVDISSRQIESGQSLQRQCGGIPNLQLECADLCEIDSSWGQFDYIIAHGVFSWVPLGVREHLLRVIAERLHPEGAALVSYNTYPGWHLKSAVRDLMCGHKSASPNPNEQLGSALKAMALVAKHAAPGPQRDFWNKTLQQIGERHPAYVYHEYLEPENHPILFSGFAALLAERKLAYACESSLDKLAANLLEPDSRQFLETLARTEQLAAEQFLDYFIHRTFRSSLIVHAANRKSEGPRNPLEGLYFSMLAHRHPGTQGEPGPTYRLENGQLLRLSSTSPVFHATLMAVEQLSPRGASESQLAGLVARNTRVVDSSATLEQVRAALTESIRHGIVECTSAPWDCADAVEPAARASTLAGVFAGLEQEMVPGRNHRANSPDAESRKLIRQLAGLGGVTPASPERLEELRRCALLK